MVSDNGGNAVSSDFVLHLTENDEDVLGSPFAGNANGTEFTLYPGTYVISENFPTNGYQLTGITCGDQSTDTIQIEVGDDITCTVTNDDIQPKLTVTKVVDGGQAAVGDFPLFVTPFEGQALSVTSGQANGFNAGDYTVSETNQQPNYYLSFSENCPNGQVALSIGDDKTCTITNTYRAPTYSVHGYKWNDTNADSEYVSDEPRLSGWTIFIDENQNKQLDEGEQSFVTSSQDDADYGWYWFSNLPSGDYTICEVPQQGWTQTYPAEGSCHNVTLPNDSQYTLNSVYAPEYNFGNHYIGYCGDGIIQQNREEQCDGTAGVTTGYHCTTQCTLEQDTPQEPKTPDTPSNGGGCRGDCGPTIYNSSVLGTQLKPYLTLTKSASKESVFAGTKNVEYTVTVENSGNTSAFDVKLTDKLPSGLTFSDGTTEKTWDIGELKVGEKKTITYLVNVPLSMAVGSYVNTATVTATGIEGINAKATLKVVAPKVLGAKLPYTGFDTKEFTLLMIAMTGLFLFSRRQQKATS